VVEPSVLPARVNQHVCIIRPKLGIPSRYIHFHLLEPATREFLTGMDAGASRQAVTKGHLESVPVVLPQLAVLDTFARLTGPLLDKVSRNMSQARAAASVRDTLLPRLISAQFRNAMEDVEQ